MAKTEGLSLDGSGYNTIFEALCRTQVKSGVNNGPSSNSSVSGDWRMCSVLTKFNAQPAGLQNKDLSKNSVHG
jgi:hypothetical protein